MKALIIIPAYNEEQNIAGVIRKAREHFSELDILAVDDGSCDATAEIAQKHGALVIRHPFNMGYGVALQTGYKYAGIKAYDYVIQMDADGQHDPEYIKKLLSEIKGSPVDVVIGSRFLSGVKYDAPINRRIGMFLFSKLVSMIIGKRITDSTSGFQALNRRAIDFLADDIYPCDYPDADVIIMLDKAGFRIKEIPLIMYRNNASKSMHSGIKPVYYVFKMFLSILVTLLRKTKERRA